MKEWSTSLAFSKSKMMFLPGLKVLQSFLYPRKFEKVATPLTFITYWLSVSSTVYSALKSLLIGAPLMMWKINFSKIPANTPINKSSATVTMIVVRKIANCSTPIL